MTKKPYTLLIFAAGVSAALIGIYYGTGVTAFDDDVIFTDLVAAVGLIVAAHAGLYLLDE